VVAVIKFGDADVVEEEGDGDIEVEGEDQKAPIKCATVQLVALFPHSAQCTTTFTARRNCDLDNEKEGALGWGRFQFPMSIIDGVYDNLVEKLQTIDRGGDHFGKFLAPALIVTLPRRLQLYLNYSLHINPSI
jgi:hypothetical protein